VPGALLTRKWKGRTILVEVLIKGFRYNNPAIFLAQRNSDCDHRHSLERSGLLRAYAPPARRERKGNPVRKSKQDAEAPSPLACDVRSTPENRLKKASIRNLTRSMHSARLPRRSFKVSGANPCREARALPSFRRLQPTCGAILPKRNGTSASRRSVTTRTLLRW
jgi:hypothetical protein